MPCSKNSHSRDEITLADPNVIDAYTLTYTAGAGGTISGDSPQTIAHGSNGTPVEAVPDTHYHFVDWSDGSTDNPRTDTDVTADITVTANFAPIEYSLTVAVEGEGTVAPAAGSYDYPAGSEVELSASAGEGWSFHHWDGPVANANVADTTVTVDADVTATAVFVEMTEISPPTGLLAYPGLSAITLRWDATVQAGVVGYNVYRRAGDTGAFELVTVSGPIIDAYYRDTGVEQGVVYYYYVTAVTKPATRATPRRAFRARRVR